MSDERTKDKPSAIRRAPVTGDVVGARSAVRNPDTMYDDEDPEAPSEQDVERFGSATRTCPECGAEVYDESEICPRCGHAFGAGPGKAPIWVIVVVVIVIAAFIIAYTLF